MAKILEAVPMEALRKIITASEDSIVVELPPAFRHRKLEVLVMTIEDLLAGPKPTNWPKDFFTDVAGG
ncbi:MAG: hypothetical protein EXR36_11895 [Betaproteobacteria bacterium]|nr:hypothetical protein [Betaproteobacteria bacterium]